MRAFELANEQKFTELSPDQQRFTSKMIMNEVKRIAKEKGISEEKAYFGYTHGLYGSDREVSD